MEFVQVLAKAFKSIYLTVGQESNECPCGPKDGLKRLDYKKCPQCVRKTLKTYRKNSDKKPVYWLLHMKKPEWKGLRKHVRDTVTQGIRAIQIYKKQSNDLVKEVVTNSILTGLVSPRLHDEYLDEQTLVIQEHVEKSHTSQEFVEKSYQMFFVCDLLPWYAREELYDLLSKMFV